MVTTLHEAWHELRWMGEVEPANVREDAVLDVATKDALLGERDGVFARIVSPSV